MAFMEQQITAKSTWIEVDTAQGIWFLPTDVCGTFGLDKEDAELTDEIRDALLQYTEAYKAEQIYSAELREGYGARLSAPGYMDCTDWCVFDTPEEAHAYLDENYGDEDEDEEAEEN